MLNRKLCQGEDEVSLAKKDEEAARNFSKEVFTDCPHANSIQTPYWLCKEVVNKLPDLTGESVLILFTPELYLALYNKYRGKDVKITIITGSKQLASANILPLVESVKYIHPLAMYDMFCFVRDNMKKFTCVVGNPPYQKSDGGYGASAEPIYHLFVDMAKKLSNRSVGMVIPSRWMTGGKGLNDFRESMKQDKSIKEIRHFEDASKIFPSISLKGGVQYFIIDTESNRKCKLNDVEIDLNKFDIIIINKCEKDIVNKVVSQHNDFLDKVVSPTKPFYLRKNHSNWCDQNDPNAITCYSNRRIVRYVNDGWSDRNNLRNFWKVFSAVGDLDGINSKVIENFFLAPPNTISTETYLVVNTFNTKQEAENFIEYMKTKFFRFMLGIRKKTQQVCRNIFAFVPDLKDYSRVWIDEDLYRKFDLNQEEIEYIENNISNLKG